MESQLLATNWTAISAVGQRLDGGSGPVTLVEFSDYQCPYCEALHPVIDSLIERHPDVGVRYRHFPIRGHVAAKGAAISATCAGFQGEFAFMHKSLFASREWHADTNWVAIAARNPKIDTADFTRCLSDPAVLASVEDDVRMALKLGITGTPTIVLQNRMIQGIVTLADLEAALDLDS